MGNCLKKAGMEGGGGGGGVWVIPPPELGLTNNALSESSTISNF